MVTIPKRPISDKRVTWTSYSHHKTNDQLACGLKIATHCHDQGQHWGEKYLVWSWCFIEKNWPANWNNIMMNPDWGWMSWTTWMKWKIQNNNVMNENQNILMINIKLKMLGCDMPLDTISYTTMMQNISFLTNSTIHFMPNPFLFLAMWDPSFIFLLTFRSEWWNIKILNFPQLSQSYIKVIDLFQQVTIQWAHWLLYWIVIDWGNYSYYLLVFTYGIRII